MKALSNELWHGPSKIILGIDIGTTHSAVSFSYFFEGGPQTVQHVSKWPGQGTHKGYRKIPTLVYYDRGLKPVCYGAETLKLENRDQAEDEGWCLAKHFKLHLHPRSMSTQEKLDLHPLPPGVSLATIYTDFLSYLLRHTQSYFENYIIDGLEVWRKYSPDMLIVMTHPNGWATREQHFLKRALRNVGPTYKNCRVAFVTEGESSVHFCMLYSSMGSSLQPSNNLIVCDAGGSTIDTTAYQVERTTPSLELKERKSSACIQTGGVFVDLECERYLTNILNKAGINEEDVKEYVAAGVEDFEATAKTEFDSPDTAHYISFHDSSLKQAELGIRRGRMSLKGQTNHTVILRRDCVSCYSDYQAANGRSHSQVSTSRWGVRRERISSPPDLRRVFTSKAAADGAVIWAAKLVVVGRVTRVAYGITTRTDYDPSNPEHQGRKAFMFPEGPKIGWHWSELVAKEMFLNTLESVRHRFWTTQKPDLPRNYKAYSIDLWAYHGDSSQNPGWVRDKNDDINPGFEKLCKIEADLSGMKGSLIRTQGADGPYDILEYKIAIQLGGTELCACIEWVEDGTARSGPISIIPEPIDPPPGGKNVS